MSPEGAPPFSADTEKQLGERAKAAMDLMEFATEKNLAVPDSLIERVHAVLRNPPDMAADIDKAIRDLTQITYPTTIETLRVDKEAKEVRRFKTVILVVAIVAILVALGGYIVAQDAPSLDPSLHFLGMSVLPVSLGVLGSLVYIFFNVTKVISEKAFNLQDTYGNYVRLFLGAIVGWVFYFAFCQEAFKNLGTSSPLLLLPFLAGFSSELVVGIINQLLRVKLTLGIEEKSEELQSRDRKIREQIELQKTLPLGTADKRA